LTLVIKLDNSVQYDVICYILMFTTTNSMSQLASYCGTKHFVLCKEVVLFQRLFCREFGNDAPYLHRLNERP